MNDIVVLIFQTLSVSIAVGTLMWRIVQAHAKKQADALEQMRGDRLAGIEELKGWIGRVESDGRRGDRALHERINELEGSVLKEINQRLSHIEGEIKGLSNMSGLMNRWLIENGAKVE